MFSENTESESESESYVYRKLESESESESYFRKEVESESSIESCFHKNTESAAESYFWVDQTPNINLNIIFRNVLLASISEKITKIFKITQKLKMC